MLWGTSSAIVIKYPRGYTEYLPASCRYVSAGQGGRELPCRVDWAEVRSVSLSLNDLQK